MLLTHFKCIAVLLFFGSVMAISSPLVDTDITYFSQKDTHGFMDSTTKVMIPGRQFQSEFLINYQNSDDVPTEFFIPVTDNDRLTGKLTYRNTDHSITAGYFYDAIGNGLLFKSFLDSAVLVDQNTLGARWKYSGDDQYLKLIYGRVRASNGQRPISTVAAEGMWYVIPRLGLGVGGVSHRSNQGDIDAQSGLVHLDASVMDLRSEFAIGDDANEHANVISVDAPIGDAILFHYESSKANDFTMNMNGLILNQAPKAIKQSSFSLPVKQYPDVLMDEYNASLYDLSFNFSDDHVSTLSFSKKYSGTNYEELYIEHDAQQAFHLNRIKFAMSRQTLGLKKTLATMAKATLPLRAWAIDYRVEYQAIDDTPFYTSINELTFVFNKTWSMGAIYEEQYGYSINENWLSFIINYQSSARQVVQLMAGKTAPGKVCSGGICINQPEFDGVKFNIKQSF